jgi:glycosyltransferase involved in cell wall biosynthesis
MLPVKKIKALIYNWHFPGEIEVNSDLYHQENLENTIFLHSLRFTGELEKDISLYNPDVIVYEGELVETDNPVLAERCFSYTEFPPKSSAGDSKIANDIITHVISKNCSNIRPTFSIFTPSYKTEYKIFRVYESLKGQTFPDWEWVILDDSPDYTTWEIVQYIAKNDSRVKAYKIFPITGGNVGLAKNRVSSLCEGKWLVELDHDDVLTRDCLQECYAASQEFPDAGFMYSDVCEVYENGDMKYYDTNWSGNWYAREDNNFDFGYAGHTWVENDNKQYLTHHYPDINPLTIRFNISMPNHVRVWERDLYNKIGGHNKGLPVADDFELIIRTFLNTRIVHIKKMLYVQYNNRNSTVDNNSIDINKRARLIRDHYDLEIHNRINKLGFKDWNWNNELGHSQKISNEVLVRKYYEEEQVMNYTYE